MYEIFKVAFSFSGAQRELVRLVKEYLEQHDIKVFMDEYYTVMIWGENLEEVFRHIYSENAKYYVLFVSKEYKQSENTFFEFSVLIKELLEKGDSYILPIYLDDTILTFIPSIGALDAKNLNYQQIGDYIIKKIQGESLSCVLDYLKERFNKNYKSIYDSTEILFQEKLDGTYLYSNPNFPEYGYRLLFQYFKKGQYEKIYLFDSQVPEGAMLTFPTGEVYKESGNLVLLNYGFCSGEYKIKIQKETLANIIKAKINQLL